MTGDGTQDGLAAGRRTDAPTSATPRLAAGGVGGPSPVSRPNGFRQQIEGKVRTLRSLRHPTVEQIERAQFWEEYLKVTVFPESGPQTDVTEPVQRY